MTEQCYRVTDHCNHLGQYSVYAHSICNLRDQIPKEILSVLRSRSDYDYDFII